MASSTKVDSAPPSPSPSIVSLPDAGSDLANLSDISSLSDEDDRRSFHHSDSEPDQLDDEEFTDVTRSMIESTFGALTASTDLIADLDSQETQGRQRTPSASISFSATSAMADSRTSQITARDLSYPDPRNLDGTSPFGSQSETVYNITVASTPRGLENSIMEGYSVIQSPKAEEIIAPLAASEEEASANSSPAPVEILLEDLPELARSIHGLAKGECVQTETVCSPANDYLSSVYLQSPQDAKHEEHLSSTLAGNTYRRANHWKPVLACSLVGLIIAAGSVVYQGENWRQTFPNKATEHNPGVVSPSPGEMVTTSLSSFEAQAIKAALATVSSAAPSAAVKVLLSQPVALQMSDSPDTPSATAEPDIRLTEAGMTLPPSVSALSSVASVGLSGLSTRVSSAFSLSTLHLGRQDLTVLPLSGRRRGHRTCKRSKQASAKPPSSLSLVSASSAALSVIPQMAQKSLSVLSHFPNLTSEALHPLPLRKVKRTKRKRSQAKEIVSKLSQRATRSYAVLKRGSADLALRHYEADVQSTPTGIKTETPCKSRGPTMRENAPQLFSKPRPPRRLRNLKCGSNCERSTDSLATSPVCRRSAEQLFETGFEDLAFPYGSHTARKVINSLDKASILAWLTHVLHTYTSTFSPYLTVEQLSKVRDDIEIQISRARDSDMKAVVQNARHLPLRTAKQLFPSSQDLALLNGSHAVRRVIKSLDTASILAWLTHTLHAYISTFSSYLTIEQLNKARDDAQMKMTHAKDYDLKAVTENARHILFRQCKLKRQEAEDKMQAVQRRSRKTLQKARRNARTLLQRVYGV
ncbi:MAG: hypothetical protein CYPHOPRED_001428 [Cyphobasidiales sp. Tagirdzhanova-0007]|nr:MAG: hypothetical protein CYPHOPRED_001428 [Cyphobasidiales sp. Tagirdzhanova-0007]